ncbi:DUF2523 domain-containing protein [Pseudomonas syringae pv. actinidiae]|uniref:DUF2523 family protein n=1 Tax=Pseudomonas syringae TaxID=317 RepID=UPI000BB56D12|nr:DUF2523 family protein [Pseudomonas syringae]PBK47817.1 hypothetical protein BUE61_28025 [Pseudomonas syringae pv. actinidiae]PBK50361.1 hypothetical protein BUE60_21930 [Pseudomonas syringae pv. actinidiae]RJX52669.1 DUF2523 domain-containing protein [Pseudomonas syringae pv. actinidiae]RJX52933.1 DUF2523 domain-containing protein [Pseudomonas syringae pv. actinidiae]RJX53748.1 DUF2523 domain-containing protein [Pseudomonas syringae pv. actinidiae]
MFQVLFVAGQAIAMWVLPRLFAALGVITVSSTVIMPIYNWVETKILSSLSSAGSDAYGFLQFLGVPNAISIIFAAYALRVSIAGAKAAMSKKAVS